MLASAMVNPIFGDDFDTRFGGGWALEEKLDGHRCLVRIADHGRSVEAFSRPRSSSRDGLRRTLPPVMIPALARLGDKKGGDVLLDGELVNATTGKAWDVVTTGAHLVFVAFDLLRIGDTDLTPWRYEDRRDSLLEQLAKLPRDQQSVSTVVSQPPTWTAVQAIWARGGEGAILKRLDSPYEPGSRSWHWLKVKQLHAATLTVIGFEAGRSGPHSAFQLRDASGHVTTVKTTTNRQRTDIAANPASFLGRAVVINYQEKTHTGHYRHGRFDHFAGPSEVMKGQTR
jgi:ATP-dependent DNA ligase